MITRLANSELQRS